MAGLRAIYDRRNLLASLVKRDIEARYRSSTLGRLWIIIFPLMMLGVYTSVFGGVFGARWGNRGNLSDFVPMLYTGLMVHALFAETVSKAATLVTNNPNYVKKVIFPLELLPVASLLTALFNAAVSFILLIIMVFLLKGSLHPTLILAPLVILPLVLYTIGIAWFIAALGVFLRDLEQIIGLAMSMLLFLSPVFYAADMAPQLAQVFLKLNPLTYPIEEMRNVVLLGQSLHVGAWLFNMLLSILVAWGGLWVFERSKPAFADVV
jgi:lipopolysaccharide transport system permease protein